VSWERQPLGSICEIVSGITKDSKKQGDDYREVPYLRVANVQRLRLDLSEVKTIPARESAIASYRLEPGDILLNEGGDRDKLGRGWIWQGQISECIHQNHVFRARIRNGKAIPKWIAYFANTDEARAYFLATGKQTTNLASISKKNLSALPVPLPPVEFQEAIVAEIDTQLSRVDETGATLQAIQAKLKQARASILKAAVEGRLTSLNPALSGSLDQSSESRIGKTVEGVDQADAHPCQRLSTIPIGWSDIKLKDLTDLVTSGSRGWAKYYSDSGPIFIRSQDINNGSLKLKGATRVSIPASAEGVRTRIKKGDILVIITGANVTISARVKCDPGEAYISQHVALCRPKRQAIDPAYLHLWLMAPGAGKTQLEGSAYGAGKPGLNLENIRSISVLVPPLETQYQIIAEVDRRFSVLDRVETTINANLRRCAQLRQAVLKRAFMR
jgi:type I restriction enzyme S subunit